MASRTRAQNIARGGYLGDPNDGYERGASAASAAQSDEVAACGQSRLAACAQIPVAAHKRFRGIGFRLGGRGGRAPFAVWFRGRRISSRSTLLRAL